MRTLYSDLFTGDTSVATLQILMASQVDTAGAVYAVIGGGIAGVSCAEEVSPVHHLSQYSSVVCHVCDVSTCSCQDATLHPPST